MANELAITEKRFTDEELKLITDTVAKGATPKELELFLYRCKSVGLDPLKPGRIHFIKYGSSPGTVVIGIDGFRTIAHRSGKLAGIKRGVIKNSGGTLTGAWAEVYRTDWKEPAREEVSRVEYDTGNSTWKKLPETMLKKVAEAAALRMAFPDDLGGVYESAEMDQAAAPVMNVSRDMQPGPNDGIPDTTYRITFGKYKGRTLEEVGADDLKSYIGYLEKKAQQDGKSITGVVAEFIGMSETFIGSFENAISEPIVKGAGADDYKEVQDVTGDFFAAAPGA